jgi:DNA-binding FadR family transcriptional regulator
VEELPGRAHFRLIADQLRTRIANQTLPAGEFLPSEARLRAEFGVTQATIRKALDLLRAEGLVARESGVGTRVVDLVMLWPGDRLTSSGPVWVTGVDGDTSGLPRRYRLRVRVTEANLGELAPL